MRIFREPLVLVEEPRLYHRTRWSLADGRLVDLDYYQRPPEPAGRVGVVVIAELVGGGRQHQASSFVTKDAWPSLIGHANDYARRRVAEVALDDAYHGPDPACFHEACDRPGHFSSPAGAPFACVEHVHELRELLASWGVLTYLSEDLGHDSVPLFVR